MLLLLLLLLLLLASFVWRLNAEALIALRPCRPGLPPFWSSSRYPPPPPCVRAQGYGFLSENARFVEICNDHGLEFIGPRPNQIRQMGDKATAKDTMKV